MFERFTDRARRVLVLAQEEARMLDHDFIGTEHILLGLASEGEGVAHEALTSLGVSLEELRTAVEQVVGQSGGAATGSPPFTPRAKKVLELALREALQLGHNYIGTEHLLLGLIREARGVAAQVLAQRVDLSDLRQQVIELLGGRGVRTAGPIVEAKVHRLPNALSLVDDEDGVVPAEFVLDPHELVTRRDVEEMLRDAAGVQVQTTESSDPGAIEYRRCDYRARMLPEVSVTVAGAAITAEAFARSTAHERYNPVHGLGDAAVFDRSTSAVRVLCGGVVFSVAIEHHRDPSAAAVALARKAVERLRGST